MAFRNPFVFQALKRDIFILFLTLPKFRVKRGPLLDESEANDRNERISGGFRRDIRPRGRLLGRPGSLAFAYAFSRPSDYPGWEPST